MKKMIMFFAIFTIVLFGKTQQIQDLYSTNPSLTYSYNNSVRWSVSSNTYRGSTGGVDAIDYASTDITSGISSWNLAPNYDITWTVWMSDNRTKVSGWANTSYSFAFVLAANNSDFTNASCNGYALIYRNGDGKLYLVKFTGGFNSNIEKNSTNISNGLFKHADNAGTVTSNGFNIYVKYLPNGNWRIKWQSGSKLDDADITDSTKYTTGSLTTPINTDFNGSSYKYCGYVWNHSNSKSAYSYWDNLTVTKNINPLPVELSLFTYKLVDGKVKLVWNTATELNNKGFYVEKNTGNSWITLGFVDGKGNSNISNSYEFTDNSQNFGKVTYRLKQVDFDGKFTYSNTIEVNVGLPKELTLMQNYPNPFNPATTISYAIPTAGNVSVKVYNSLGQEVATLFEGYQEAGMKQLNFNANNLNSGIYYCVVNFGNSTKVTKMLLMK